MRFAGSALSEEWTRYDIIGIPFDGNSSKKGARYGPNAIRKASLELETFIWDKKIEVSELGYYDRGDIKFKDYDDLFHSLNELDEKRRIFLGGDHSISLPTVSAIKNVSVISIDAHTDFRDVYVGNRFSNACVMRRIGEIIGFENIVEIGIRSSSKDEYEFVKDRIEIIDAERLKEEGPGVIQEIEQDRIYLSIDMDVLDPGISRGVGDPEPDGLSTRDLILLLRRIFEEKEVISCDIVEVNPFHDVTSFIAARIVLEILSSWELNV